MEEIIRNNIEKHKKLVTQFENNAPQMLIKITMLITDSFKHEGCLYLCGNGGSAADAQHVAGEFVGRFRKERKPLPAIALNADTSILTCIGNDYSYKEIFARQVEAMMKPKDILWAFSTSGKSPNILAAAEAAKTKGAKIVAFTGKENSKLENLSDLCLCAASNEPSSAQEIHQLAYHIICGLVEDLITNS
jgi:D-sedoheptulose 7-phosphate isomerase